MSLTATDPFAAFSNEAPAHAKAWGKMMMHFTESTALDSKTHALVQVSIMCALGLTTDLDFQVERAKQAGATREEVICAALTGLPAAGARVLDMLPLVREAYGW